MDYFAYGSNLLHQRLRARTPSAVVVATAWLPGHVLRFHKIGTDGSGKCDARYTGRPSDLVRGVVYRLTDEDRAVLDRIEGVGTGYEVKAIWVETASGRRSAFTYVVQEPYIDPEIEPFEWYKGFVVAGARQNGLPAAYIEAIERVTAQPDPDEKRAARNRSIAAGGQCDN